MANVLNQWSTCLSYHSNLSFGLVWFLSLLAYQPSWVSQCQAILIEKQLWYFLTHSYRDKRVHTFRKGISPKVNVIVRLENEIVFYDVAISHNLSVFIILDCILSLYETVVVFSLYSCH